MTARPRQCRNRTAGFTLLEALIATALMAMILIALATISAQWMPNWNRGMTRVQQDENLALGLDRLLADLTAAEFIPGSRQTLKPLFDGTSHSVTFVRTALSPNASPGLEIVRYGEVSSANGPVLVRTRAPFVHEAGGDREQPRFADPVALVRAPFRILLSYAGADRIWRDSWQQETLLPKAVRVTVRDAATNTTLAASTAALLHVEIPADCINAKSIADCLTSLSSPTAPADSRKL
jgi:general secretion pathway protein J